MEIWSEPFALLSNGSKDPLEYFLNQNILNTEVHNICVGSEHLHLTATEFNDRVVEFFSEQL